MEKFNANMPSEHYDAADARAIVNSGVAGALSTESMRFDDAEDASIFFARELDYVKSKSYDKEYPELTAEKNFPVSHEVNEGAETVTWYGYDKTGFAKIISNYATDLPKADVKGEQHTSYVKSIGSSFGYSVQDMRASRLAGKSLDTRRGEAARYQIDRKANDIAWAGDTENGLMGILTKTNNVPVYTIPNGASGKADWDNKTVDEIIADVAGMRQFMADTTMNVETPDTFLLPPAVWIKLSTRRIPDTGISLMKYLQDNFTDLTFKQAPELSTKSTTTNPYGKNVVLMYKNDPDKLTIEVPLKFMQYAAQPRNLEVIIPCEERHAGAIIYYPMSLLIAAGV